jgi:hypothetical protein
MHISEKSLPGKKESLSKYPAISSFSNRKILPERGKGRRNEKCRDGEMKNAE